MVGIPQVLRLLKNVVVDLRYGGFLGGNVATKYRSQGAHDTVNSDYAVLERVFDGRVRTDDVLCDVGCGKGRVLNYWLSRGLANRMIGIELDPEIADGTRRRLAKRENVRIVTGDAVANLPDDATLFYLYNPFSEDILRAFVEAIVRRGKPARVLYYHPQFKGVFTPEELFETDTVVLEGGAKPLLIATFKPPSAASGADGQRAKPS